MTRTRRFALGLLSILILSCGSDPHLQVDAAPLDAEPDAMDASTTTMVRANNQAHSIEVTAAPLRIRVLSSSGEEVLSFADTAFELGLAPGGDTAYHEPTLATLRNVTWTELTQVLSQDAQSLVLADASNTHAVRVQIEATEGDLRLHFEALQGREEVALVRARLKAEPMGTYQGLGERFYGADARGRVVPMQTAPAPLPSSSNEHHVPIPFFVSTAGHYGVFAESREAGAFDVGATDAEEVRITFEGGRLDLHFFMNDDPREVVASYTRLTGLPILPPRFAFAPMHWRNEWASRSVLEEDMARIRAEGIPCTSFWIDNPWQTSYNDFHFDTNRFPEPQQMLDGMIAQGYVPLLWSTPYLKPARDGQPATPASELFNMANERGWFVQFRGDVWISPSQPGGGLIDFTNRDASDFWKSRVDLVTRMGVRSFKLDYGEDIIPELFGARTRFAFSNGQSEREMHAVFNTRYHEPYRRALDEVGGGFLLVRASSWGGQTVADIIWPGDLDNDMREAGTTEVGGLPAAISGMISLSASGFPNFGSDTGGYRGGMPTRETLLRWAEHTAFSPILQLGGAGAHHNPWLYDEEAGNLYRTLARAHMDLVPYFRMWALRASREGFPPVVHPSMVYSDATYTDPYSYLLGDEIFVAPVIAPGASERVVRLPPGTWVHYFTRVAYEGGREVTVPAPIGVTPAFLRAGALVPMLPHDVATLAPAVPPTIDIDDRPYLRALWLADGSRTIRTEEGPELRVQRSGDVLTVTTEMAASGLQDVRFRIERGPRVTSAERNGQAISLATSLQDATENCTDVCVFVEGDVTHVSMRQSGTVTLR